MSLKRNILANYASQIYVTAVGIVMVPLHIKYLGTEAYGLVGFFAMLQAWFNLLDMGLTPTMARETARYLGGSTDAFSYRSLARALEGVFAGVALIGGTVLFVLADWIALNWLNAKKISVEEISIALQLISIVVAMRLLSGLYRGVITGSERLVWLSGFNSLIATGRNIFILPIMIFVSSSTLAFFSFQLIIAVLELIGLSWMAYKLFPSLESEQRIQRAWAPLKPVLKFSFTIAFTASVWILVTQTDKLVLSKILPLEDYAFFTIAVLVSTGIFTMSVPISSAIMPRMARLESEGKLHELVNIYRYATQLVGVIVIPAALILVFFSEQVLWAWTGSKYLVEKSSEVLQLYAAGYAVLAFSAFPYYLQYAKGDLKLHFIGNILVLILLVPGTVFSAIHFGMVGSAWAWLLCHTLYLVIWTPFVHKRFMPGMHWYWLALDVVIPVSGPLLLSTIVANYYVFSESRLILTLELIMTGVLIVFSSLAFANKIRLRAILNRSS